MRKGFRSFCNGDTSTSTLNQHHKNAKHHLGPSPTSCAANHPMMIPSTSSPHPSSSSPATLEEMILQLELEEELQARKTYNMLLNPPITDHPPARSSARPVPARMSCVNTSDIILRSVRKAALNQYPRFSLDGKDAMYRNFSDQYNYCTFPPPPKAKKSPPVLCCDHFDWKPITSTRRMISSSSLAGDERVVWCKPGVVAKLMGLEAIPVPATSRPRSKSSKQTLNSILLKRQNLPRRAERHEIDQRRTIIKNNN